LKHYPAVLLDKAPAIVEELTHETTSAPGLAQRLLMRIAGRP
jgi:hypothetical protein